MSGRKYSQVVLAENIKQAIRVRVEAEEAFARAESLVAALNKAAEMTESLNAIAASAEETLSGIREELESFKELLAQGPMMGLTLPQLQERQRKVEQWKAQLDRITQQCRDGNNAAASRADLMALLGQLETNRNQLEPWLVDVYDSFVGETRSLLQRTDHEIQTTGSVHSVASDIQVQADRYDSLIKKAGERQEADSERQYIAAALRKVCEDMAFSVKIMTQQNPIDDLVLEVNTFAYGILHFCLEIDGTIRSESNLVESSCFANFSMLEDGLRSLGVDSRFYYEDGDRPVRIQKGEKSLPDSEPAVTMEEQSRQ